MLSKYITVRLVPLSLLLFAAFAQAQEPAISSVTVTNDDSLQLIIGGLNLSHGSDVVATLGNFGSLSVDEESSSELVLSAAAPIPPGDYVLTVTTSTGTVKYGLTIGAMGPLAPLGSPVRTNAPDDPVTNAVVEDPVTNNTAVGVGANAGNTGVNNSAFGRNALRNNATGIKNTATGTATLITNTTGSRNTATGNEAMRKNIDGGLNTATGDSALKLNTSGDGNTATGLNALRNNTTGSNNIALGTGAGINLTDGDDNIAIGNPGVAGESDTTRIGTEGTQTRAFMAGIDGNDLSATGKPVVVNPDGQLGTGAVCTVTECSASPGTVTLTCPGGGSILLPCILPPTVFVTSDVYTGDLVEEANNLLNGGAAGANHQATTFDDTQSLEAGDAICQYHADNAFPEPLPGTWIAWLSASGEFGGPPLTNARDRLASNAADGPYIRTDGATVSAELATLLATTTTSLQNAIDKDENRTTPPSISKNRVWTGTKANGLLDELFATCADWIATDPGVTGLSGFHDLRSPDWTDSQSPECDNTLRIYCFKAGAEGAINE